MRRIVAVNEWHAWERRMWIGSLCFQTFEWLTHPLTSHACNTAVAMWSLNPTLKEFSSIGFFTPDSFELREWRVMWYKMVDRLAETYLVHRTHRDYSIPFLLSLLLLSIILLLLLLLMPSIISTLGYILIAPFITVFLTILGALAVVTSAITSSFISIKLALLACEFGLGIALTSIRQFLSWLWITPPPKRNTLRRNLQGQQQPHPPPSTLKRTMRRSSPPADICISFKAPIKKKYSLSVPSTPDITSRHFELNI